MYGTCFEIVGIKYDEVIGVFSLPGVLTITDADIEVEIS